jgi:hypothetical protein
MHTQIGITLGVAIPSIVRWYCRFNMLLKYTLNRANFGRITSIRSFFLRNSTSKHIIIHRADIDGKPVLARRLEATARAVFNAIGRQLQLPGESGTHFAYLGLATDFIGVDVHQRQPYIELSVENCISRLSRCHGWDTPPTHEPDSAFATPLSPSAVDML